MADPIPTRPTFSAAYGIASGPEGMLPWPWATERLERARNYWVATARADGAPHAAPVWGLWREDAFVFSTALRSRKAENLRHDGRAVVHLESGEEAVLLEGRVEEIVLDDELAGAYEAKYALRLERDPDQLWFRFRPAVAAAWRESDYTTSATRFVFPRES